MGLLVLGDLYYGFDYISEDILGLSKFIKEHNYSVVLNLEGAVIQRELIHAKKRGELLAQSTRIAEVLRLLNVKGVSLCNNHMFDFGHYGLLDTVEMLEKNHIQFCGAGMNESDASRPMRIDSDGVTYEFYAATDPFEESVCACSNRPGCFKIKDLLKTPLGTESGVIRIAFLHTGFEYNTLPMPRTISECRQLIDNKFDAVVCSHPHIVQPFEVYRDKPIYYSLGNFYFSTFRDFFEEIEIRNKPHGICNFGYGVVFHGKDYSAVGVCYDPQSQKNYITEETEIEHLVDTGDARKYISECKSNRNNHNPVLSGNAVMDCIRMSGLNFSYFVYGILQKLGVAQAVKNFIFKKE